MSRRKRRQSGAQREFEQEGRRLVAKAAPSGAANVVEISFPGDHPLAREFLELSTLLANRQKFASGVEVARRPILDADDKLLAVLAKIIGPEHVERIKKDLAAGDALLRRGKDGKDPLLEVGIGLLHAASAIAGMPDAGKRAEDLILRAFDDAKTPRP